MTMFEVRKAAHNPLPPPPFSKSKWEAHALKIGEKQYTWYCLAAPFILFLVFTVDTLISPTSLVFDMYLGSLVILSIPGGPIAISLTVRNRLKKRGFTSLKYRQVDEIVWELGYKVATKPLPSLQDIESLPDYDEEDSLSIAILIRMYWNSRASSK